MAAVCAAVPWAGSPSASLAGHSRVQNCLQSRHERRQIELNRLPDYVQVDGVVTVDQPVAHADDLRPRNLGVLIAGRLRESSGSFTNYRKSPSNRGAQIFFAVEVVPSG